MKKNDIFSSSKVFYANFTDVSELKVSNAVKVNGLIVGNISKMRFEDDTISSVVVEIQITNKNVMIPKDSHVETEASLLGNKSLNLVLGKSRELAQEESFLSVLEKESFQKEVESLLIPVIKQTENVLKNFSKLSKDANESVETITKTFKETQSLIRETKVRLNQILEKTHETTANLHNQTKKVSSILDNVDSLTGKFLKIKIDSINTHLTKTLVHISSLAEKTDSLSESTISKLFNEDSLYNNLNETIVNVNLLVEDLRLNPKRYFSLRKKNTPYKQTE